MSYKLQIQNEDVECARNGCSGKIEESEYFIHKLDDLMNFYCSIECLTKDIKEKY